MSASGRGFHQIPFPRLPSPGRLGRAPRSDLHADRLPERLARQGVLWTYWMGLAGCGLHRSAVVRLIAGL